MHVSSCNKDYTVVARRVDSRRALVARRVDSNRCLVLPGVAGTADGRPCKVQKKSSLSSCVRVCGRVCVCEWFLFTLKPLRFLEAPTFLARTLSIHAYVNRLKFGIPTTRFLHIWGIFYSERREQTTRPKHLDVYDQYIVQTYVCSRRQSEWQKKKKKKSHR